MKKEHYRLDSSIDDLQCETSPIIKWLYTVDDDSLPSPDFTEMIYQFWFPN